MTLQGFVSLLGLLGLTLLKVHLLGPKEPPPGGCCEQAVSLGHLMRRVLLEEKTVETAAWALPAVVCGSAKHRSACGHLLIAN